MFALSATYSPFTTLSVKGLLLFQCYNNNKSQEDFKTKIK